MCVFVCVHLCMYVLLYVCISVCMYACMNVRVYVCVGIYVLIYIYIHIYSVSQEECAILRENVPYVKVYRYKTKHMYPNLNGYGDNCPRIVKL